jgi:EAL domain-containing protein (putative c-di-GMP-specific phosphodiesterase class I)
MQSLTHTKSVLATLRTMGVRIAIDDFGTGYSSLSYLSHFPVQTVKVDRSFVAQIDSEHASATLACAIVSMAHSLGLEVVAEGVETGEQQQHLMKLGCELLQGFRFSKPVALQQLPTVLDRLTVELAVSPAWQAPAADGRAAGCAGHAAKAPERLASAAPS